MNGAKCSAVPTTLHVEVDRGPCTADRHRDVHDRTGRGLRDTVTEVERRIEIAFNLPASYRDVRTTLVRVLMLCVRCVGGYIHWSTFEIAFERFLSHTYCRLKPYAHLAVVHTITHITHHTTTGDGNRSVGGSAHQPSSAYQRAGNRRARDRRPAACAARSDGET